MWWWQDWESGCRRWVHGTPKNSAATFLSASVAIKSTTLQAQPHLWLRWLLSNNEPCTHDTLGAALVQRAGKTCFSDQFKFAACWYVALIRTVKVWLSVKVKNNVTWLIFFFVFFFVIFVLNDLGLSLTLSPGLVQVSFQFTFFFFFTLSSRTLWIYYIFFLLIEPGCFLWEHTVNSYFDQTTPLSLNSFS